MNPVRGNKSNSLPQYFSAASMDSSPLLPFNSQGGSYSQFPMCGGDGPAHFHQAATTRSGHIQYYFGGNHFNLYEPGNYDLVIRAGQPIPFGARTDTKPAQEAHVLSGTVFERPQPPPPAARMDTQPRSPTTSSVFTSYLSSWEANNKALQKMKENERSSDKN